MDRLRWTDADVRAAWREHAVTTYALADPEVLPLHLRDASRDPHWQPRPAPLPRRPKHAAPTPADEEPSPVGVPVRRATPLQRAVLWGIAAGVLLIGFAAFRGLTGG